MTPDDPRLEQLGGKRSFPEDLKIEWDQPQFAALELESVLGEGSGSKVWKASWDGGFAAVKVLKVDPSMGRDALRRFVQEANILRRVRHPSICAFIGTCMQQGFPAIVIEYIPGGSLHELLHCPPPPVPGEPPPLPLGSRLLSRIALEVATGVAYLHDNAIIHRDVKAANVLLDDRKHAKVTDFGISTPYKMEHTAETGTYRSMAPEVISHNRYDSKCDVYSFGVLLWEILHQAIPFQNDNGMQVAYAVATEQRRPPISLRPDMLAFRDLIVSCWKQQPDDRPDMPMVVERLMSLDAQVAVDRRLARLRSQMTDEGSQLTDERDVD